MRTTWKFATANQFIYGRGAIEEFASLHHRDTERVRALILCDPNIANAGHLDTVQNALAGGFETTTCLAGNAEPSMQDAQNCIDAANDCDPTMIIGIGGGSNLDLAKITAIIATHGGSPRDYFGFDRVPGPTIPVVAVPTTAGTGSEVSHSAVLTDTEAGTKVSTLSRFLRPAYAVVDPRFTDSCPQSVTAESGIDALVHAIEAYTARRFDQMQSAAAEARAYEGCHPLGKVLATEAIRSIGQHLTGAVDRPSDASRDAMALAASYAGMAFSNCGVALVHGLEYPLGALVHCSHGAGNGTLLPYVMRFNLAERYAETAEIGRLLGVVHTGSEQQMAEATIDYIIELRKTIGIPHQLREYGLQYEQIPEIAEKTFGIERLMTLNPREASLDDLVQILQDAY